MILEAKGLKFFYKPEKIQFQDVNLSVNKGEILAILGANGAGKSTLLNCLGNLLKPQEGEILIHGEPMAHMSLNKIARSIGYVPQRHNPAYGYQVRDFIVMGRAPHLSTFQIPSRMDYEKVDNVMEEFNIGHLGSRSYLELSGGERQQVLIARTIVQEPDLIMLDEPANYLDYGNQLRMIETIKRLANRGLGVIITSHIPDHVLLLDDKVGILDHSGHFQVGTCQEMIREDLLKEIYNVDVHLVYEPVVNRTVCLSGYGRKNAFSQGDKVYKVENTSEEVGNMIYDYKVMDGKGNEISLSEYKGKVLLIVNTATECGFTPQYGDLQKMYEDFGDKGLVILDFPCNQFGGQAPGSVEDITAFCTGRFGVTFPQMDKIEVNGENESPLYTYLKEQKGFEGFDPAHPITAILEDMLPKEIPNYKETPDIKWNFTKFLVDRDGNVVYRFEPTHNTQDVRTKIEELL